MDADMEAAVMYEPEPEYGWEWVEPDRARRLAIISTAISAVAAFVLLVLAGLGVGPVLIGVVLGALLAYRSGLRYFERKPLPVVDEFDYDEAERERDGIVWL